MGHEHYGLTALAIVLASLFSLPLPAMPTREETTRAVPVVKRLLSSERAALAAGKKTRSEVADAALKLAQEADTEAAKLLLMKGAFVLYVKDGKVEKAAQTMNAIEKTIADLPPQTVTNMIDLALLGLPNKKEVYDQLCQKMHPNGRVASMRRPPAIAAKETKYLQATVDDYTWSYRIDNGEATIEAEKNGMFVCAVSPNPTGDIAIPSMLDGVKVTSIGQEAFCHYKGPKSVKIPEGVKSIGWCAFYRCSNLVSVTLPSSLKNIGHGAFSECGGLTDITIPAGVTNIEADAFSACTKLKSITIPSGVKSIKGHAFDLCGSLTSITIPDGVESIDRQAFYNCRGLKAVNIPAKVKSMGMAAFARCADLASVTMLGEKPNAPDDIFNDCPKLTEIHVPANAKSWAGMKEWQGKKLVFDAKPRDSKGMTRNRVAKLFPGWSLDTEVAHEDMNDEESPDFHPNHRGLDNVVCVHPIAKGKSAVLSRTMKLTGKNPCLSLKVASWDEEVNFLLSVRVNGKEVMPKRLICTPDAEPWENITIPLVAWGENSVKVEVVLTANGWWYEFPFLARLEIGEGSGREKFISAAKATDNGYTWSYRVDNGEATIVAEKNGDFPCAVSPMPQGDVSIPAELDGFKVTRIGRCAFTGCSELSSVTIPKDVSSIGWCAFIRCWRLTSVIIPSGVKWIERGAFAHCRSLTSVQIPENVTDIGIDAFLD